MAHLVRNPQVTPAEFEIVVLPPIDDAVINAVKNHYDSKSVIVVTHSPANLPKEWKDAVTLAIVAQRDDRVSVASVENATSMSYEDLESLDIYFPNWKKYEIQPWYVT